MFLKFAEISEFLEVLIDLFRVNFDVFMDEDVAQAGHWQDVPGEINRNYSFLTEHENYFFVIFGARPVVFYNDMVGYV